MTTGSLPSTTDTTLFVVPRSIPTTLLISTLLAGNHSFSVYVTRIRPV
jgi:hypothetical protein